MSKHTYRRWTTTEVEDLRQMSPYSSRLQLANHFGRSISSISAALDNFGIRGGGRGSQPKPKQPAEITTDRIERALYLMETVSKLSHYTGVEA
jgi:hypothetical protein